MTVLMSGLERCPACHPERSEGSLRQAREILRCAQDDRPSLHMSGNLGEKVISSSSYAIILDVYSSIGTRLVCRNRPYFPCRGSAWKKFQAN